MHVYVAKLAKAVAAGILTQLEADALCYCFEIATEDDQHPESVHDPVIDELWKVAE